MRLRSGRGLGRLARQRDDEIYDLQEHGARHRLEPGHPACEISRRHLELAAEPRAAAEELSGLAQQFYMEAIRHASYV